MFWDLVKFFDSIEPVALLRAAFDSTYPLGLLYLSVLIHLFPRVLVADSLHHTDPVEISNAIAAGFCDSTTLTKLLLRQPIKDTIKEHPAVNTRSYVDDLSQQASGKTVAWHRLNVAPAAASLYHKVRAAGPDFSVKSLVVGTTKQVATAVADQLKRIFKISIRVGTVARDIGADYSGGAKRILTTQKTRFCKAT